MGEIDEAELVGACRSGLVVDGAVGGGKRAVQAALLRRCCLEFRDQVDPRGLRLANAVVAGCLDLAGAAVAFPLSFEGCEFDCAPVLEDAQLPGLSLTGCPHLPGLLGNGLRLSRDLDLSRSRVVGAHWTSVSMSKPAAIWLCESEVGGRLLCAGTVIEGQGCRSIQADRIHVGGSVRLINGFSSVGEVRLHGARIDGSLDLNGAQIVSLDGPAIDLENAVIQSSVFLIEDSSGRAPHIRGRIAMASARISARLVIRKAVIEAAGNVQKGSIYERPTSAGTVLDAPRLWAGAEVMLTDSEVTGRIDMSMSDMSSLSIVGNCVLRAPGRTALDLTNAGIRAMLRLDQSAVVEGTLRLAGAVIHGALALHGQITQPEDLSLISGSALTVDGDVYLGGLRASGGDVNFRGARLGSLSASRAQLHNPGGYSLRLSQALVKGPVRLIDGFTSAGLVVLNRATIEGRLHFTGGTFGCPAPSPVNEHGHAIEAISATVHGSMDLGWANVSPGVDFTDVTTTFLADDPATWPERFIIAGLTYDRFDRPQGAPPGPVWDQAARCAWLRRQSAFDSGSYEQAAKVFRQHGYAREAEQILIAQRRHARRVDRASAPWPRRALDTLYAAIGYGYRPGRVLYLLAALLVLVIATLELPASQATLRASNGNGAVYTTSGLLTSALPTAPDHARSGLPQTDTCGNGEVRCFSPVLYAIDTVIPLISLDQRSTWYPDPHVADGELILWLLNLATLLGWLLSSIFALSLARLSRGP
ncbi:MAG TPA: hypothetical protein VGI74_07790 [Streptosporangiaceae bacterium]